MCVYLWLNHQDYCQINVDSHGLLLRRSLRLLGALASLYQDAAGAPPSNPVQAHWLSGLVLLVALAPSGASLSQPAGGGIDLFSCARIGIAHQLLVFVLSGLFLKENGPRTTILFDDDDA